MTKKKPVVYIVSDSIGETAEFLVKAASSQFNNDFKIKRVPYVTDKRTIIEIVRAAKEDDALIAFTLVVPELVQLITEKCLQNKVPFCDLICPMINGLSKLFQCQPKCEPGLIHKLDDEYFRKVEAIEFAVKYDDGKDPKGMLEADVVLIGVSRTSKTPISMYLAHKQFKVVNIPLLPEIEPPNELLIIPSHHCFGLTIDPIQLNHIRLERLKSLGLPSDASYASLDRILLELEYAEKVIRRIGCSMVDVSNKAIEETANIILNMLKT